ncbi:MAG: hypothetical protein QME61_00870 [Patescibacteria group bacterium]|nr:hypothetical protein [Patescibacteria group bacterium]
MHNAFFYSFLYFLSNIKEVFKLPLKKIATFSILLIICLIGILRQFPRSLPFFRFDIQNAVNVQAYNGPLNWLEKNVENPSVIWANDSLSNYVPILTRHYVLFSGLGQLHLVPSKEVEERYLTAHFFDNLKIDDIKKDFGSFAGAGYSENAVKDNNLKAKICRFLRLNYFGKNCPKYLDAISLRGEEYFDDLFLWYTYEIKPNIIQQLKKFQVAYLIRDKKEDINFKIEFVGAKIVYQDERFLIYKIIY